MKEYTYNITDIKGSPFLLEDCINHRTYLNETKNDNDLDTILNGINNNLSNVEIIQQLPNVSCDNVYSIYNGIKAIRNDIGINEQLAFQHHFMALLDSFGFDFEKMLCTSKAHIKAEKYADINSLLVDVVELFCKWCKTQNYDIIDILL